MANRRSEPAHHVLHGVGNHPRNAPEVELDPPRVRDRDEFRYRLRGRPDDEWTVAKVLYRNGPKLYVQSVHPDLEPDAIWMIHSYYRTGCDLCARPDKSGQDWSAVWTLEDMAAVTGCPADAEGLRKAVDGFLVYTYGPSVYPIGDPRSGGDDEEGD